MPKRDGGASAAPRHRSRAAAEEEDLEAALQRLLDKLRASQPSYDEDDVAEIPFPSEAQSPSPPPRVAGGAAEEDSVPCSPTSAVSPAALAAETGVDLDKPLSLPLFETAVNLFDAKSLTRNKRTALDAVKLIRQGYALIWQDADYITRYVETMKRQQQQQQQQRTTTHARGAAGGASSSSSSVPAAPPPEEPLPPLGVGANSPERLAAGASSLSPSVSSSSLPPSSQRSRRRGRSHPPRHRSVSPLPEYTPPPGQVRRLDACVQSVLVYANSSTPLRALITSSLWTLRLLCFIACAARVMESEAAAADSAGVASSSAHAQRDVDGELDGLTALWGSCGVTAKMSELLRESYLLEFLVDVALPPAVCSSRYEGLFKALYDKKQKLVSEMASGRVSLGPLVRGVPLRALAGLCAMSSFAEPRMRARLLDRLTTEGLQERLRVELTTFAAALTASVAGAGAGTSRASAANGTDGDPALTGAAQNSPSQASQPPRRSRSRKGSPAHRPSADDDGAGDGGRSSPEPENTFRYFEHLLRSATPARTTPAPCAAAAAAGASEEPAPRRSTSPATHRRSKQLKQEEETPAGATTSTTTVVGTEAPASAAALNPVQRVSYCIDIIAVLTSVNLRPSSSSEPLQTRGAGAGGGPSVVRATAWAEDAASLPAVVVLLLWFVAVPGHRRTAVSLSAQQEQAAECLMQIAAHSAVQYDLVVKCLTALLASSDKAESAAAPSPPRRAAVGRPSSKGGTNGASAAGGWPRGAVPVAPAEVLPAGALGLMGGPGLLPMVLFLVAQETHVGVYEASVRAWFAWLARRLLPDVFEQPELTAGRRSRADWGDRRRDAMRRATLSLTPVRGAGGGGAPGTAPVMARDLQRAEMLDLSPYFHFTCRLLRETRWRAGAEPFLARVGVLAYHVLYVQLVRHRRANIVFGQASSCYQEVAPLLETVGGVAPGEWVPRHSLPPTHAAPASPVADKTPARTGRGRGSGEEKDEEEDDELTAFIPSPSRSPIFYESYREEAGSPSSSSSSSGSDSDSEDFIRSGSRGGSAGKRHRSPPSSPSPGRLTQRPSTRARGSSPTVGKPSPGSARDGKTGPSSPPGGRSKQQREEGDEEGEEEVRGRGSWRDHLSLRMLFSAFSGVGYHFTGGGGGGGGAAGRSAAQTDADDDKVITRLRFDE